MGLETRELDKGFQESDLDSSLANGPPSLLLACVCLSETPDGPAQVSVPHGDSGSKTDGCEITRTWSIRAVEARPLSPGLAASPVSHVGLLW